MQFWKHCIPIAAAIGILGCSSDENALAGATWTNGLIAFQLDEDGTGLASGQAIKWSVDPSEQKLAYTWDRTGNTVELTYRLEGGELLVTDYDGWGTENHLGLYSKR